MSEPSPGHSPFAPPRPPRRSYQFGLGAILAATAIVALLAALLRQGIGAPRSLDELFAPDRGEQRGESALFVLLVIVLPVGLLIVLAATRSVVGALRAAPDWWRDLRGLPRRRPPPPAPPRTNPWDDAPPQA